MLDLNYSRSEYAVFLGNAELLHRA
jgi:hypothetical protein